MGFKHRSIASVEAYADKPVREDYETDEAFQADLKEWEEAQKGPDFGRNDEDAEHGPGTSGWVNPDSVTGPSFGGEFVDAGPAVKGVKLGHDEDPEHGPGVQ